MAGFLDVPDWFMPLARRVLYAWVRTTVFPGQTRFSLEGLGMMVPFVKSTCDTEITRVRGVIARVNDATSSSDDVAGTASSICFSVMPRRFASSCQQHRPPICS